MMTRKIEELFRMLNLNQLIIDHSFRVAHYAKSFGIKLQLGPEQIVQLYYGSLLHDVGKCAIPADILYKPGKLTDEEYELIKQHPVMGCQIVEPIESFHIYLPIIRHHHERIDGRGYPDGLQSDQIPFLAKIVNIADAYDAMTSNRSYRSRLTASMAIQQLIEGKGSQFDCVLVDHFIQDIISNELIHYG